ncbi:uroporphyrinogen-III synthase [Nakamurella sp. UYEF19]|uniref:uroporphyrinogen-III synthase n=1 Tax=Nakamurella sp. UYEF19 TaxID=1756392 RepID=UPI0033974D75
MSPLDGWRVLVPRPLGRGASLVSLLSAEGAVAQAVPMIAILPPDDLAALDAAVMALAAGEYSWVGFTSVNALSAVTDRAGHLALSPAVPADTRVAAVGPATAAALRTAGLPVDLLPEHGGSAAALATIWPAAHPDESVLLPQSEIAGPILRERLRDKGFRVESVTAYRTLPQPLAESVAADLVDGEYEAVLLTSPSTAESLARVPIAAGTVLGAIGRSTTTAATAAGLDISFTAADPTDASLVGGLAAFATRHPRRKP